MTRGMITIATGKPHYYMLAANLLLSYRKFSKNPMPFAIIAEEENEYTALFDDVIITTEATRSFMDKILLLKLSPYDENIFFDADSLAYGDLNEYWDFFEGATDFSSLGENFPVEQPGGAWYDVDGIGKYGPLLPYKTRVHMGVCFIRNSSETLKMYETILDIQNNKEQVHFHTNPRSIDEGFIGIAMPMHGFLAIEEKPHMMAAQPCLKWLKADLLRQQLSYGTNWGKEVDQGILIHWGTSQTYRALYRFNAECLHYMIRRERSRPTLLDKLLYDWKLRYGLLYLADIPHYTRIWLKQTASRMLSPFRK